MTDAPAPEARADVELRLPADGAFVAVLRAAAAAIAGRLDLAPGDIEDLRTCVGEAGTLVIPVAAPGSDLVALFRLAPGCLLVELAVQQVAPDEGPDRDSFAWQVLGTVADEISLEADGTRVRITFSVSAQRATEDAAQGGATTG